MTLTEFKHLLDAHGPHHLGWPARERDQAVLLLASSKAAKAAMTEALVLDHALSQAAPVVSDEHLAAFVDRVVAAAPMRRVDPIAAPTPGWVTRLVLPSKPLQAGLAAFATICFVVGVVIGSGIETTPTTPTIDLAGLPLGPTATITIGIE